MNKTIAVLADTHIHPGGGPDWTPAILEALKGVDLIVTLGDMGESVGLDALAAIAPVTGVRGMDDQDDPRTAPTARIIEAGGLAIGCVFDPKAAGLAAESDPLNLADSWTAAAERLFGRPIDVLLYASTHKPAVAVADGKLLVNPGSATLPVGGENGVPGAFARLTVADGRIAAEIVFV